MDEENKYHQNQEETTGRFRTGNRGRPRGTLVKPDKKAKREAKALKKIREEANGDVMTIYLALLKNTDVHIDKGELIKICRDLAPFQASKMAAKEIKTQPTALIIDHSDFKKDEKEVINEENN